MRPEGPDEEDLDTYASEGGWMGKEKGPYESGREAPVVSTYTFWVPLCERSGLFP